MCISKYNAAKVCISYMETHGRSRTGQTPIDRPSACRAASLIRAAYLYLTYNCGVPTECAHGVLHGVRLPGFRSIYPSTLLPWIPMPVTISLAGSYLTARRCTCKAVDQVSCRPLICAFGPVIGGSWPGPETVCALVRQLLLVSAAPSPLYRDSYAPVVPIQSGG